MWSKNIGPLIDSLPEISQLGHVFCVQHSITGYPRELEHSVTGAEKATAHLRSLANRWGSRSVVWRYDPILISDLATGEWHVENFGRLAAELRGAVDEVVVSFAQFYKKTKRNLDLAASRRGFGYRDPPDDEKIALLSRLVEIAGGEGMRLTVCTQPSLLPAGAKAARCIDALRLSDLRGRSLKVSAKGNRPGCECAQCIDIGDYDTCPHGCVYCYAVRDRGLARERHRKHDSDGEFLSPSGTAAEAREDRTQPDLFGG